MRYSILVVSMALAAMPAAPAMAQLSLSFNTPGLSIGVNIPTYPDFEQVPGYPVYYTPRLANNLFFYDGMYWLLEGDTWYASTWYNGPWQSVEAQGVPLFVLRVPVRYYRSPPGYFRGWQGDAPPRWDDHWGPDWSQHHRGWNQWNHRDAPRPAPLPTYQRQYSGARYPQPEQQQAIRQRNDKYQPRDAAVRQRLQQPAPAQPRPATAPQQPDRKPPQRERLPQREQQPQQAAQQERTQQEQQQDRPGRQSSRHEQPQSQQSQAQQPQQSRQEQQHKPQGRQPAQPEKQQSPQQPPQQNKAPHPDQPQQAPGREPQRHAAPAPEPAKEAKPPPERNKGRDKADQGNEDNKK